MILQALYRYHQLLLDREGDSMPGEAYSSADVSFEVQVDEHGYVVAIIPYIDEKGRIYRQKHNVPKQEKRTSGIEPYFLCEKAEYLFGSALASLEACRKVMRLDEGSEEKQRKKLERLTGCRVAMKGLWQEVLANVVTESPELNALHSFLGLADEPLREQLRNVTDEDIQKSLCGGGLCVLKYVPTGVYFHRARSFQLAWERYCSKGTNEHQGGGSQVCLVTGAQTPLSQIARLHPNIKNAGGPQASGAAIVSFNIESFRSYGREQSYNAPTSQKAADAYGYVLNRFLADPNHRVRMNDTTVVFWAESTVIKEQDWFACLFQAFKEEDESPHPDDESVRARVRGAVARIQHGQQFTDTFGDLDANTTFYVLGLSPNIARLSIRFWYTGTLGEIGEQVWRHFRDLSIIGLGRTPTIRELLREIAVGHDWDNIPPNLEGQMLRSILLGLPYSRAVFAQLMNRIRSESDDPKKGLQKIGAVRAAMIKAYLLRYYRTIQNTLEEEITMAVNEQSKSIPYHLGRLFACLEKAQVSALGQTINTTIRDRFWGAASATPANVFPRLLSLAQHHIAKDEKWGRTNDQRIQEVMNSLPPQFPRRLSLEEQGMFALGYYHQRQDL